ncbi:MAG TPA: hypothetical protein ENI95_12995 [Chloroflexi bacterium]|nr:hypothetical protein [Chloroflexota bacterium]
MRKLGHWWVEALSLALLLALVLASASLFIDRYLEHSFIAYRYARNLAGGLGFVYNAGERVLSEAVAPLYVMLLAAGTRLTPDLPFLGNLIGIIAIALGGVALYGLAHPSDKYLALLVAALYVVSPLLWITLGLDTALWVALGVLAIWFHLREWGLLTGLVLALATLMRPEIGVLICVLIADSLIRGRPLRLLPAGSYLGVVTIGVLWGVSAFESGGPLPGLLNARMGAALPDVLGPNVLTGLSALAGGLIALSWGWFAVAVIGAAGLLFLKDEPWALLLVGWAGLHLLSLAILGAAVRVWDFVPLVPALAALTALGVHGPAMRLQPRPARLALGGLAVLLALGAAGQSLVLIRTASSGDNPPRDALLPATVQAHDQQAGEWLREHTPQEARVGTTRVGLLGYLSGRYLLDYGGRLQPELAQALMRGDSQWWIANYTPDYVVLRAGEYEELNGYSPASDPWFTATYREAARFDDFTPPEEAVLIFERTGEPPPLQETLIGLVSYPDGLMINGIATDFSLDPLESGRMARVRIEWLLEEAISEPQYVSIRIQGHQEALAALEGRMVDFSNWPRHRLITTYHVIELAPALTPGIYDVSIGVGPDPFNLTWQTVAQAKVPIPEGIYLGGVSGTRAEFGDIALLGYRLARTGEGLEVLLMWQALEAPQASYRVSIQVRDVLGTIVARLETEPLEGAYPTSIWSAGEEVPDTYLLDMEGVPPGDYDVYVSLISPDGLRLLTAQGQDAVFIGRVSIGEETTP